MDEIEIAFGSLLASFDALCHAYDRENMKYQYSVEGSKLRNYSLSNTVELKTAKADVRKALDVLQRCHDRNARLDEEMSQNNS